MSDAPFPGIAAIELLVDDLASAVGLLADVFGLRVVERGAAPAISGRQVVLAADNLRIVLVEPAGDGDRPVLPDRSPRMSAWRVAPDAPQRAADREARCVEAGLVLVDRPGGTIVLAPEAVAGAVGWKAAVVLEPPDSVVRA